MDTKELIQLTDAQIVSEIKDLLEKVATCPRKEKYQYIIHIYDILKSNKNFVKSHNKFYLTLKKNALELISQGNNKLHISENKEKEDIGKTIFCIVNCINIIDN